MGYSLKVHLFVSRTTNFTGISYLKYIASFADNWIVIRLFDVIINLHWYHLSYYNICISKIKSITDTTQITGYICIIAIQIIHSNDTNRIISSVTVHRACNFDSQRYSSIKFSQVYPHLHWSIWFWLILLGAKCSFRFESFIHTCMIFSYILNHCIFQI